MQYRGRHVRDGMVVNLQPPVQTVPISTTHFLCQGVLDPTLCDKVCQGLVAG